MSCYVIYHVMLLCHVMLTNVILCYITCVMSCYITNVMLYNTCHVN